MPAPHASPTAGQDSPPLPLTRLRNGEYVFDAETAADSELATEIAGLLDCYLFWRDALAIACSRSASLN